MKVSGLVGLDRVLGNIRAHLRDDEADQEISDLFNEIRCELGEPDNHTGIRCGEHDTELVDYRTHLACVECWADCGDVDVDEVMGREG